MPRTRQIRPGFFTNEALCSLPPTARLLFAGLWTIADREGRLLDSPSRIKAQLFPHSTVTIPSLLNDLAKTGFILRYAFSETSYIQIIHWHRHQRPHPREDASQIPPPEGYMDDSQVNPRGYPQGEPELTPGYSHNPSSSSSSSFPSSSFNSLREKTPNPSADAPGDGGETPHPRARGTNARAVGTNPRANGTNPRAVGTNPRRRRNGDEDAVPVCRCDELRADLAVNRNAYPFCELHGDVRKVPVA
jgi:hypothetical protein